MVPTFGFAGRRKVLDAASGAPLGPASARHLRHFIVSCFALAIAGLDAGGAAAQDAVKLGLVMPMTGALASNGREAVAAAKLYMAQHGDTVAGKKIELIVKDDASIPQRQSEPYAARQKGAKNFCRKQLPALSDRPDLGVRL
jgi:Periplasmic binding protein